MKNINSNEKAIELMIDEFEGTLSDEGKTELQQWINSGPDNEHIYREFHQIKNSLDILSVYKELDQDESWDTLKQKLNFSADSNSVVSLNHNRRTYWWISAAAIMMAVIGLVFYQLFNPDIVTLSTLSNERITYSLPDGSSIVMNENTTIKYNKANFAKIRELKLVKGEAFFEVVHNPEKIFKINIGNLRVTDIGTSFVVKRSESEISVIVNSGRVAFEHLYYGNRVILDPGKKGVFLTGAKSIIDTPNMDNNYKSWLDKKMNFNNTPLSEVAKVLERTYGSKVILKNNSLKRRTFNASLHYQTIDSALVIISASLQLKVRKSGQNYIID